MNSYHGITINRPSEPQEDKTHYIKQLKISSSKKMTCKGTLRQVFFCLRPRTPHPPPYSLNTCIQYTYSHREGGGRGGRFNQREG
jgi:hypothetical protein